MNPRHPFRVQALLIAGAASLSLLAGPSLAQGTPGNAPGQPPGNMPAPPPGNMPAPPPGSMPAPPPGSEKDLTNRFFNGPSVKLSPRERAAMRIAEKWRAGDARNPGMNPVQSNGGNIVFVYGVNQPSIVCAVLQICDIALQAGEQINSVNVGDAVRWTVEPAVAGSGEGEVQHLLIKPLDVGLETSLVVTTSRRSYHMLLRSHRTQFMPRVSFMYPEDAQVRINALRQREAQDRKTNSLPVTKEYLGDLDFGYEISGAAPWKPVRVFNDGVKTIIQMPPEMKQTESPSLLLVRDEGGLFSDPDTQIVNYRMQGDRYIVDALFDKAILVAGVGGDQDKVTIRRLRRR